MSKHSAPSSTAGPEALVWAADLVYRGWRWVWTAEDRPVPATVMGMLRFGLLLVLFLVVLLADHRVAA